MTVLVQDDGPGTWWVVDRRVLVETLRQHKWTWSDHGCGIWLYATPRRCTDDGTAYDDLCQDLTPVRGCGTDVELTEDDHELPRFAPRPDWGGWLLDPEVHPPEVER